MEPLRPLLRRPAPAHQHHQELPVCEDLEVRRVRMSSVEQSRRQFLTQGHGLTYRLPLTV